MSKRHGICSFVVLLLALSAAWGQDSPAQQPADDTPTTNPQQPIPAFGPDNPTPSISENPPISRLRSLLPPHWGEERRNAEVARRTVERFGGQSGRGPQE